MKRMVLAYLVAVAMLVAYRDWWLASGYSNGILPIMVMTATVVAVAAPLGKIRHAVTEEAKKVDEPDPYAPAGPDIPDDLSELEDTDVLRTEGGDAAGDDPKDQ
jgi:hypothetical protein